MQNVSIFFRLYHSKAQVLAYKVKMFVFEIYPTIILPADTKKYSIVGFFVCIYPTEN